MVASCYRNLKACFGSVHGPASAQRVGTSLSNGGETLALPVIPRQTQRWRNTGAPLWPAADRTFGRISRESMGGLEVDVAESAGISGGPFGVSQARRRFA